MNKIVNLLLKISNLIESLANFLKYFRAKPNEYYVYIPTRGKPYYKHISYKNAENEAHRLAKKCTDNEPIEILHIEQRIWGDIPDVPF